MQAKNFLERGGLDTGTARQCRCTFRDKHAEHSTTDYFINKVNYERSG
jgi:hypothetical protein